MSRSPGTLRDIALALNLSDGTVSRALSGRGDIAQETRTRVAELAAEMNYSPRRKVAKGQAAVTRIAVCMGDRCVDGDGRLDPSHVGLHVLDRLEQAASRANVSVMVAFVDAMDAAQRVDRLPMLQAGETHGIILVYPFPEATVRLLTAVAPVVSIEHVYPSASVDVVGPTHAVDAMSAVEHLHKLGHRRIAYVGDELARGHRLTSGLRHAGFVSGMGRCDLPYRPEDVINVHPPTVDKTHLAQHVAERIRDGVTAVVTSIDRHGYRLWDQLPGLGIRVPEDVSIAGIGGIYRAKGLPQLTTWRCNFEGMSAAALDALTSRRAERRTADLYSEIRSLFVQGESTAPPRG